MPNQFTDQGAVLDAAITARQADLEAYRQRLILADPDPTNYSPDYSERDGVDSNADGLTWDTDLAQFTGGAGSGGGSILILRGRFDWGGNVNTWRKTGTSGLTFGTYEPTFSSLVVGSADYGYQESDPYNGDMGLLIEESGLLVITFEIVVLASGGGTPTNEMFDEAVTSVYVYSATGLNSTQTIIKGSNVSHSASGGAASQAFIDESWVTDPDPDSLANVLFGANIRLPNATSDTDFSVGRTSLEATFIPGVSAL